MKGLNERLTEAQVGLQAEIVTLKEVSAAAEAEVEEVRKKAADDIARLEADHTSLVEAHVLAAELRQQEVQRLEGRVLILQQAAPSTVAPPVRRIDEIPRQVLVDFLSGYFFSRAFDVTCRRILGYFLGQGFSMLREFLYEMDPTINLRDMRMFEGERMRVNGRTLL